MLTENDVLESVRKHQGKSTNEILTSLVRELKAKAAANPTANTKEYIMSVVKKVKSNYPDLFRGPTR